MQMRGRTVLFMAIALAGGYWYVTTRNPKLSFGSGSGESKPDHISGADTSDFGACLAAAEKANAQLADTARLFLRPPVDQTLWKSSEGRLSSDLADAEAACSGGSPAQLEVGKALSLMNASFSDLKSAAAGSGGATELARRQGDIDEHLNRARVAANR